MRLPIYSPPHRLLELRRDEALVGLRLEVARQHGRRQHVRRSQVVGRDLKALRGNLQQRQASSGLVNLGPRRLFRGSGAYCLEGGCCWWPQLDGATLQAGSARHGRDEQLRMHTYPASQGGLKPTYLVPTYLPTFIQLYTCIHSGNNSTYLPT